LVLPDAAVRTTGEVTITPFDADAVPHPLVVVRVNDAVPLYPLNGVHVAFKFVAEGLNVPPAELDQIPVVAEPPTEPPSGAVVPPGQIDGTAGPALAVAAGETVALFDADAVPHPLVVVRVNVAVPLYPLNGFQVAFKFVAEGLNVPPAELDQIPVVAEPPTEPPSGAVVPPVQIVETAGPALAVAGPPAVCETETAEAVY
jgi:hypothetical protein